ncbi:MAG: transmembrane amino acid transporter protein-domain-containing protein [Monoraphidium minutum]|nr:MAG: transmembrane amino acid transporter protein-domain-containing protein [Monoraphidium minutum]
MLTRSVSTLGAPEPGRSHWMWGVGHIICANVGAGILALPNAVAWLGLVGGPIAIIFCTWVAMYCGELLTHAYRAKGRRRPTFKDAVAAQLGGYYSTAVVAILYLKYFLVTIGYTVIASSGMLFIANWACEARGVTPGDWAQPWVMALIFSAMQLFLSQFPDLESVAGGSALGAIMSLCYTAIALGLTFSSITNRRGSAWGRSAPAYEKVFGIFNGIGTILFANGSGVLVVDIQHTLREPPASEVTMKKVVRLSYFVGMTMYCLTGVSGYVAIGDAVGSNILTEFKEPEFSVNKVVPLIANIFTVIHFIPAYQVFAQPLFVVLEQAILKMRPGLALGAEWPVRLVYRTLFVFVTAALASTLPFFSAISGLIGAIAFWPTVVAAPITMYIAIRRPPRAKVLALQALMWFMLAVSFCALIGSVFSFISAAKTFQPFKKPH